MWQECMAGGMHGRGVCMVGGDMCGGGGHVWQGTCMVGGFHGKRGVHGRGACMSGGTWQGGVWQILQDMVNEWAVCILLECRGGHVWGCGRGHAWQGVCMAEGHAQQGSIHGRGCVWQIL